MTYITFIHLIIQFKLCSLFVDTHGIEGLLVSLNKLDANKNYIPT